MTRMLVTEQYELVQTVKNKTIIHGISDVNTKDSSGASTAIADLIAFYYDHRKQYGAMTIVGQKTRNVYVTLGSK